LRGVTADLDPESGDPDHLPLTPNDLTKGQANDMITKVKYGARGRFDKLRKQKAKVKREKERWEKEQEIRQRESVAVGALNA
jgi:hypothetical protein